MRITIDGLTYQTINKEAIRESWDQKDIYATGVIIGSCACNLSLFFVLDLICRIQFTAMRTIQFFRFPIIH